jgi:hypothetical protein
MTPKLKSTNIAIILALTIILFNLKSSNHVFYAHDSFTNTSSVENIDLEFSRIITESEISFDRSIFFETIWDNLVLNMTVQNFGDPLDGVVLKVSTDNHICQHTFSTLEQVGLVKVISYQFELQKNLILPLNISDEGLINIRILIILDHTASVQKPDINFSIHQTEIIAFDNPQPVENMTLPLFGANQRYIIQPAKLLFLEKKLLAHTYLFSNIPLDMQLETTIKMQLNGVGVDQIQIDGDSFYSSSNSVFIFNLTITERFNDFISLNFIVYPNYYQVHELTEINMLISISGKLNENSGSRSRTELGINPIPWWLMYPLILIGLFAFPYYNVYKEHLMTRDEEFIDTKRNIKLK